MTNKWTKSEISKYYLLSKSALEIQNAHAPKQGDLYSCACNSCEKNIRIYHIHDYDMDSINKRDLSNVMPEYAKMIRMASVGSFHAYYIERCKEYLSYVWLPRQDQLQDMLDEYSCNTFDMMRAFNDFCKFDEEGHKNLGTRAYVSRFSLMEELWMAFVMYKKFEKSWDGEKWISI